MTDRELLKLAAKAARLECNPLWFDSKSGLLVWEPPTNYESRDWNPLTDDGDALRLAVALKMLVNVNTDFTHVAAGSDEDCEEFHNGDPYAATRRAIVRAAAAMAEGRA